MYAVGRLSNYISQGVYSVAAPFHPFGGAVDIIVVQQEDGTFKCSPWYVKFGKFQGVLKRREKIVAVSVNGKDAGFHMYLDHKGEAYFLKEPESDEEASIFSPPSAPSSGDEIVVDRRSSGRRISFKEGSFKTEENATSVQKADERLKSPDGVILSHNKEEISGSFSRQSMSPNVEEKQCENGMLDNSGSKSSPVKNGKIHSKPPSRRKSILSFVFRNRSSELQVVASDTDQNDEQRERNEVGRSESLEQAKLIADLLDTKWANGDTDNKEGMEMNVFFSSAGDEAQSPDLSVKLSEQKMISDGNYPLPQDKDPVGNIANQEDYVQDSDKQDEKTQGDYLHLSCDHDGESSVDNCAKMDNVVQESDPQTCQSQTETVMFSMEETLNKSNKFDEQTCPNDVAEYSEGPIHNQVDTNSEDLITPDPGLLYNVITDVGKGCSKFDGFREKTFENNISSQSRIFVCDQEYTESPQSETLNLAEHIKSGVDVLSTCLDDSQDARLTHVSSMDLPSEVSKLITPILDVGADSDLCVESERICKIQKVVDNVLQFPISQELMEHNKQEEDLQQVNSMVALNESFCDHITSTSLSDGCDYPTNSLLGSPCDPVLCAETCERTETVQQLSDDEVEFVTNGGEDGINKITSETKTDNKAVIHVMDQKQLNRSPFCDHDALRETIICDQKLVSWEASNRPSNLIDLVDDIDSCTQSNLGTVTSKEVPDSAVEPSIGGWNGEIEQLPFSVKLDEEAFTHAMCAKQPDRSSFSDFDTNRSNQRLTPEEAFNYTNAQEDMEVTLTCDNLIYCQLDTAQKVHFQMQHEVCKLECSVSNNNPTKLNEAHIHIEETYSNQTIRSETIQDLEMNFNDEYVLNRCLATSEFHPTIQEGTGEHELSLCIGEQGQSGSACEDENSNEELVLSDKQPDDNHTSTSLDLDLSKYVGDSTLEYSNDNGSQLSRIEIAPINILGRMEGKEDTMQTMGSLPNLGNNFLDMKNADTGHVFSRSLDSHSSYLKRGVNYDPPLSNSQNTESRDSEKEVGQNWTMRENSGSSKIWTTTETASASVHPCKGVEISLCRHLLFEGMGTDAAAQAFDSLKMSLEQFLNSREDITLNENLVVRMHGRYFSWDVVAHIVLGMVAFGLEGPPEPEGAIPVEQAEKALKKFASDSFVTSGGGWRIWPFLRRGSKTPERSKSAQIMSNNDLIGSQSQASFDSSFSDYYTKTGKSKERSNTPTSEQLASLNLNEGQNIITFTFSTRVLGKQQVDARIYLWKWNTRIVVSDVDGTITKSDVLGQFMPLVGKDWTQSGVAHLFSAIKDNGYQLMFLSARAIAQAYLTRQFLLNIKQDGKALPDGPIVISPDGLFPSLYREVIRRAPHEFKIACLEDIRKLFPPDCNPFYAGFGNRDTDEISYLKVGIPKGKIFIINPKGEVAVNHRVDTKSYTSLHSLVNGMFPAMSSSEQEDFNSWNYWKTPLPNIDV